MGILKGCLKVAGTLGLGAVNVASTILRDVAEMGGADEISGFCDNIKQSCAENVHKMWSDEPYEAKHDDTNHVKKHMAETVRRAAKAAKDSGNMERYEQLMEQYEK